MILKKVFVSLLALAFGTSLIALPLSIFYTGDSHGTFEAKTGKDGLKYGGYPVLEEVLNRERAQAERSLFLDSGDQQTGSIFASLVDDGVHGGAVIDVFNLLGLEASVFGNHEFDFSYQNTKDLSRRAKYPFVCTNMIDTPTGKPLGGTPFKILEKDGLRVGIFGITLELLPEKVKAENVGSVRILPPVDAINMYLDEVERKSDIIIVLSHQGFEADSLMAQSLDDRVDIIIGGHDHIWSQEPINVNGKWLLYSGSHLNWLGHAEIEVEDRRIVSLKNRLIPLVSDTVEFESPLNDFIALKMEKIMEEMGRVVGSIPVDWSPDKWRSTSLSRWTAQALIDEYQSIYKPELAIINNGGFRKFLPAGRVTLRDLHELIPFSNTITVFSLKGSDLLILDEINERHAISKPHDICEVAGWEKRANPQKEAQEIEYFVNGEKLEQDRVYRVVSHDFVAGQWDKYLGSKPFDVYDTGELLLDAVIRQVELQFGFEDDAWD